MHNKIFARLSGFALACAIVALVGLGSQQAVADSAAQIDGKVDLALKDLFNKSPAAKKQAESAKGVLVFPDIIKAGLMIGGQYGRNHGAQLW